MPPKKKNAQLTPQNKQEKVTRSTRSKGKPQQPEQQPKKAKPKVEQEKSLPKRKGKGRAEQQDEKPTKKGKKESKVRQSKEEQQQKQQQKKGTSKEQSQQQKPLKKMILKGSIPVDPYFTKSASFKIFADDQKIYAATLNQSNVMANNNKFYIIQLLQNQTCANDFILFTRWGRVGVQGQSAEQSLKSEGKGVSQYNKKLNEKLKKSYRLVEMNYEENAEEDKEQTKAPKKDQPQSTLPTSVQDLIRLIFDMKMMTKQMKEIGFDANKMPLGKLAKSSILKGYEILKEIMNQIKGHNRKEVVSNLSSDFYSEIPHNFGFQNMSNFTLNSEKKVKDKLQMLQSLQDIQVFTKLVDEGSEDGNINELDSNYNKLNINISPLDKSSPTYQILLQYVANTHAKTHTAYKLQVLDIFQLQKEIQIGRYKKEIGNKQLLWHGSRLTNFVGILSQGLRIAPPEAPVTGYMFGKGVYFADMVTKSANYCFTSRENNVGLMLLCEVALGEVNEKFYADYYANLLPQGKHSTKGCGKNSPKDGKMLEGVLVPCGQGVESGLTNSALLYNQFIVYDVGQIKCRYLLKMRFNYC